MPAHDDLCRQLEEALPDLVREAPGEPAGAGLLRHAATCPDCATALRRERALQAWLTDLPDAPSHPLSVPDVTSVEHAPVLRLRYFWAAAAAAALVVALWAELPSHDPRPAAESERSALRILDDESPIPDWDERVVGLAAGAEQMASIRPAEGR